MWLYSSWLWSNHRAEAVSSPVETGYPILVLIRLPHISPAFIQYLMWVRVSCVLRHAVYSIWVQAVYACGRHLLEMSFVCTFFRIGACVCVFTPHPHSAPVWSLPDILCGLAPSQGPKTPLLSFPPCTPNPFQTPYFCSSPPIPSSHSFFLCPPSPPLSFHSSLKSLTPSLLQTLPQSFQWCSPSSPGRSWSFLTTHREWLGFSRLSLPQASLPMQLEKCLDKSDS